MKKILFPGSFDPITIGHENIIKRALCLSDEIVIAIGKNSSKGSCFSLADRMKLTKEVFKSYAQISVVEYETLTVELCKELGVYCILRGVRTSMDFEYERIIAQTNKELMPEVETLCLVTDSKYSHISSTVVRDIIKYKGDISKFVPFAIREKLRDQI